MRGFRPEEVTCPRCGITVIPDRIRRRRARIYQMLGTMSQRQMAAELGVSQACIRKDIAAIRARLGLPATAGNVRPGPKTASG